MGDAYGSTISIAEVVRQLLADDIATPEAFVGIEFVQGGGRKVDGRACNAAFEAIGFGDHHRGACGGQTQRVAAIIATGVG
jgi:hypothetical protein